MKNLILLFSIFNYNYPALFYGLVMAQSENLIGSSLEVTDIYFPSHDTGNLLRKARISANFLVSKDK